LGGCRGGAGGEIAVTGVCCGDGVRADGKVGKCELRDVDGNGGRAERIAAIEEGDGAGRRATGRGLNDGDEVHGLAVEGRIDVAGDGDGGRRDVNGFGERRGSAGGKIIVAVVFHSEGVRSCGEI